jgi:uncharacterized protein (DUF1015 family)
VALAEIAPFRGVRFDRHVSGPIGPLVAPPYDVPPGSEDGSQFSIRRIEDAELGDPNDQHQLAARRYRDWLDRGVLRVDDQPAIYVHRHEFDSGGSRFIRTGIIARVRLRDWADRIILPHERTMPGPRQERLERLREVGANLSPLYLLYRDPTGAIRDLIAASTTSGHAEIDQDRMGGTHLLVRSTDHALHRELGQFLAERTLFVADGHHRYEAALTHRNEQRLLGSDGTSTSEYVLALLSAVEDPGVRVRPTHRLLAAEADRGSLDLEQALRRWFSLKPAENDVSTADDELIARVILAPESQSWDLFPRSGNPHSHFLPAERGSAWRSLGVATIDAFIAQLPGAIAADGDSIVRLTLDECDAIDQVRRGRARAAFLLPPPNIDRLLAVAEEGDLLPAKSTWFEPKAPAGLVISDHRY